ncbi:MAG: GNAT family N-acetyltransferase [Desulfovermiculus sp.]
MSDTDIQPGQNWQADSMHPEDAEGVCRLFRLVYGPDYPIKTYIQPDELIKENRAGRILSSVARTENQDIVGHVAIFYSAPSDQVLECGSAVVHRHYRHANIAAQLTTHVQKRATQELQAAEIWLESVLNHDFSQKICRSMNFRSLAFEVDLMPAAAYTKERSAPGRVSTLMDFLLLNPRPHRVLLPAAYKDQLQILYSHLPADRDLGAADPDFNPEQSSQIQSQTFPFAQVARMAIHQVGRDFQDICIQKDKEGLDQGMEVLQTWLRLTDPGVGRAVDFLRTQGYFFGGLLPRWFDDDGLLMQKTLSSPRWDEMRIAFDQGRMLADMVKEDWRVCTSRF